MPVGALAPAAAARAPVVPATANATAMRRVMRLVLIEPLPLSVLLRLVTRM